jgi:uncharacterized membrane protein HdeD (DUF308 family)
MNSNIDPIEKRRKSRLFTGIILVGAGTVYLLSQFNLVFVPYWLFTWPMLLIIVGLASGARHNFRNPGWFFMVTIGMLFLLTYIFPAVQIAYLWPVFLILIGVRMMFGRDHYWGSCRHNRRYEWRNRMNDNAGYTTL